MVKIGVKVFRDPSAMKGKQGGSSNNDRDKFAKLGKDGMSLRFVFLNDLPGEGVSDQDMLVQCYVWKWIAGMTKNKNGEEKFWNVDIPQGEDDPSRFRDWASQNDKKATFQYMSNVFILKAYLTESGQEVELGGDPISTPWSEKSVHERVRILIQGNDTSKQLFIEGQERRNDGKENAIAYTLTWTLDRFHADNRTKYGLRKGDEIPGINPEILPQVTEKRHDILDTLNAMQKFGFEHWQRKFNKDNGIAEETNSSPVPQTASNDGSNDTNAPDSAIASSNVKIEGEGDAAAADFDDIKPEDIQPDSVKRDFVG